MLQAAQHKQTNALAPAAAEGPSSCRICRCRDRVSGVVCHAASTARGPLQGEGIQRPPVLTNSTPPCTDTHRPQGSLYRVLGGLRSVTTSTYRPQASRVQFWLKWPDTPMKLRVTRENRHQCTSSNGHVQGEGQQPTAKPALPSACRRSEPSPWPSWGSDHFIPLGPLALDPPPCDPGSTSLSSLCVENRLTEVWNII